MSVNQRAGKYDLVTPFASFCRLYFYSIEKRDGLRRRVLLLKGING